MSNPSPISSYGPGSFNSTDARTPEVDPGHSIADASSEPAHKIITSPLNMRCSDSEVIVYSAGRNGNNHTPVSNEPIDTPLGKWFLFSCLRHIDGLSDTSSVQSRDSSSGNQRRSAPPPPRPRRTVQSSNSRQTTSNPGSGSPLRSHSVRRPAPPPPQSTRPTSLSSPISGFLTPTGPLSPNPAMISSISELTQQVDKLVSSVINEDLSRQARGRRKLYDTKVNCLDFNNSNADGVTMNIGGSKNSGSGASLLLSLLTLSDC